MNSFGLSCKQHTLGFGIAKTARKTAEKFGEIGNSLT